MAQPRRAFEKKNKQPINQFIKAEKVRLISQTGEQLGVVELKEALAKAKEQELDLVQMNKDSDTPVCKMMDMVSIYSIKKNKRQLQKRKQKKLNSRKLNSDQERMKMIIKLR